MTYSTLDYRIDDGILTLTLNRPELMNAFTVEMANELVAAFNRASEDDAVRPRMSCYVHGQIQHERVSSAGDQASHCTATRVVLPAAT